MGEVIQFIPRPNPDRDNPQTGAQHTQFSAMEHMAAEIMGIALCDTAPCEYVAPDKDPA